MRATLLPVRADVCIVGLAQDESLNSRGALYAEN